MSKSNVILYGFPRSIQRAREWVHHHRPAA